MDEVMANRNATGNGLGSGRSPGTGPGDDEVPLKPFHSEPTARFDDDPDPSPNRRKDPDGIALCALNCGLTPKKALIYLIFCGILIVILLAAIFLLMALWPEGYSSNVCQSSECHFLSAQILGQFNQSVEPCENFWEFSCGGWFNRNPIPPSKSHWSTAAAEELRVKDRIRMLINTRPDSNEVNAVDLKLKRFYQSCMGLENIEADKERGLKKIIEEHGGWEVLRTFRQNEFNFRKTLQDLQGEYRISPFFQINVVADPRTPSRSMIRITPAGLSLPDRSYYFKPKDSVATAFHYYAKDVVQLLGATSDAAVKFAEDLFQYERRIARITPDPFNLTDPVANFHVITVSRLKSKSSTIFWDELLTGIFPQGQVNDLTEILVPSVKYLEDISNVISTTDRQVLNNYLMWHLTLKYSIYLNKPFADLYYIFEKESMGRLFPPARWEFCVDKTIYFFPHAINGLLAQDCEEREEKREKIEILYENLKTALKQRIVSSSGIPESWINFAVEKLRLMTIQVGTPIRNNSVLADMYLTIAAQRDYFFPNVISATRFSLVKQDQVDLGSLSKDTTTLWTLAAKPFEVTYIPAANKIVVAEAFLQNPLLLASNFHLPSLYAWMGVQLGERIAQAFGPEQGLFLASGDLMQEYDPKVQETRDMIESKRVCLSSFFTSIRLDDDAYVERTALDTLLHLGGIQMAFDAFKALELQSPELPSMEKYGLNSLFFIAYTQSQCSSSTIQFHDLEHNTFRSLSHDHRVRGLLRQLVGFTESMECSRYSEMYADFSCGYFL